MRARSARAAWLRERKKGIGGSDVPSVYNDPPWGCRRRLWYDKTDVPPDYAEEHPVLRLGTYLEEFAATEYQERTSRKLSPAATVFDPERPWRRANPDRIVTDPERGKGVLEIKTLDPNYFRRVQAEIRAGEAFPVSFIRQHTWTTMLAKFRYPAVTWGAFTLLDRGSGASHDIDLHLDTDLFEAMGDAVDAFWQDHIVAGVVPDPLDESDGVCRSCAWRKTCRGAHLGASLPPGERAVELEDDPSTALDNAASDYLQHREEMKVLEAEIDEVQERMKALLTVVDDNGVIVRVKEAVRTANGGKIYYKEQTRTTWDGKALESLPPLLRVADLNKAVVVLTEHGLEPETLRLNPEFKLTGAPFRNLRVYPPPKTS